MGSSNQPSDEARVPLSIVLISIGLLILLTGGAILVLRPVAPPSLPGLIPLASMPDSRPTAEPLPTLLARQQETGDVLLPSSPLYITLPSEARADEAPTVYRNPAPNQPARIVIPALQVDAPVWETTLEQFTSGDQIYFRWRVPNAYGAGWHNNSALLGQRGNTVLNGHHNVFGAIFRELSQVPEGADLYLYDFEGNQYHYRVVEKHIFPERDEPIEVRRGNAHWMERKTDERITLVTCWPATDNTHRLVVIAQPITP